MTLPGRLPQRFMLGVWAVPLLYDRSAHPTSSIRRKRKLGLAGEEEEPPPSDPAEYAAVKRWDEIRSTDKKEALPFHIMIGCSYTQYVIYRHNTGWMTLGGSDRLMDADDMMDGAVGHGSKSARNIRSHLYRRIAAFCILQFIHLFFIAMSSHMSTWRKSKGRNDRSQTNITRHRHLIYRASSTRTCSYSLAT